MKYRIPMLAVLAVLACGPAAAAAPGNSYAEFSWEHPDEGDRGAAFRASFLVGRRLVLDGGIDAREHKGGGLGLLSLGLGFGLLRTESTRMVLGLSAEGLGGSYGPDDEPDSISGLYLGAGFNWEIAHRFNERVEVYGRLKATSIDEISSVASIGARFYMWKHLALGADLLQDDYGTRVGVGLRFDFSRR